MHLASKVSGLRRELDSHDAEKTRSHGHYGCEAENSDASGNLEMFSVSEQNHRQSALCITKVRPIGGQLSVHASQFIGRAAVKQKWR